MRRRILRFGLRCGFAFFLSLRWLWIQRQNLPKLEVDPVQPHIGRVAGGNAVNARHELVVSLPFLLLGIRGAQRVTCQQARCAIAQACAVASVPTVTLPLTVRLPGSTPEGCGMDTPPLPSTS